VKIQLGRHDHVLRFPADKGTNKLEKAGAQIMNSLGVCYEEQVLIGSKFVVDVLIPQYKIVIQWDGDFWHGNPKIYQTFYPIQESNKKRDHACNAYLAKCGYQVLRFWESDVHIQPLWVKEEIRLILESSHKT
jgi:very-short-patch-repair endonuclease